MLLLRHLWLVLRRKRSWRPCRCLWTLHGLGSLEPIDLHPRGHVLLDRVCLLHLSGRARRMSTAGHLNTVTDHRHGARGARQKWLTGGWWIWRPWRHLRRLLWRPEEVVLLLVVSSPPAAIHYWSGASSACFIPLVPVVEWILLHMVDCILVTVLHCVGIRYLRW